MHLLNSMEDKRLQFQFLFFQQKHFQWKIKKQELKNSFLVTALVSKDVKKVTFDNGKDIQESLFGDLDSRLRNIQSSPSGIIFLLTDGPNGQLIKVLPQEWWK